jgi:Skp family chaperone for outer membrane proteins
VVLDIAFWRYRLDFRLLLAKKASDKRDAFRFNPSEVPTMTLKILGAASAVLFLVATSAQAAPDAPAPALQPFVSGPPVAGVCVYHNDAAISASTAGQAAVTRMQQLRAQVSAELLAERQSIQADAQALEAKRTTLTQEQLQQQAAPIQQRGDALQRKAQLRQRELQATSQKVLQRLGTLVEPILHDLYQTRACSLLFSGDAVLVSNPAMDLTPQVVAQLNTKMSTITFDREVLPQQK